MYKYFLDYKIFGVFFELGGHNTIKPSTSGRTDEI